MEATQKAPAIATTETFKGRVNGIKLIRQLGTKNGYFTESLGKQRAIKLIEELSAAADLCLRNSEYKNVELTDSKKDIHMLDFERRTKIAENYTDSEEAQRLCSVSLMNKQDCIFESIKLHVNNTKVYGKRKKNIAPRKEVSSEAVTEKATVPSKMSEVVYNRKNFLEVIDADLNLAMKIIKADLDQVGGQRIEMPDAVYLRMIEGSETEPKYTIYKITNEVFLEAYAAATRTSPRTQTKNC